MSKPGRFEVAIGPAIGQTEQRMDQVGKRFTNADIVPTLAQSNDDQLVLLFRAINNIKNARTKLHALITIIGRHPASLMLDTPKLLSALEGKIDELNRQTSGFSTENFLDAIKSAAAARGIELRWTDFTGVSKDDLAMTLKRSNFHLIRRAVRRIEEFDFTGPLGDQISEMKTIADEMKRQSGVSLGVVPIVPIVGYLIIASILIAGWFALRAGDAVVSSLVAGPLSEVAKDFIRKLGGAISAGTIILAVAGGIAIISVPLYFLFLRD